MSLADGAAWEKEFGQANYNNNKRVMETNHKEFKAFDKVLVRDFTDGEKWSCDFYSHESGGNYCTIGKGYFESENILPYEGNEHLVGKVDEPDEGVKLEEGEWVMHPISRVSYTIYPFDYKMGKFLGVYDEGKAVKIQVTDSIIALTSFIKFSDFNPNDMEETKKHILCVKNGKVVKYKG